MEESGVENPRAGGHFAEVRIIIAPDKFKGSLSAREAAEAIRKGLLKVWPDAVLKTVPVSDGGEGTAEAIRAARTGVWITLGVRDPLGKTVPARYAWMEAERLAVIEMSEASGLWRVDAERRDPLRSNTYGTGELIADANKRGAEKIIVGLGGSATNDGGIGMAAALGYQFLTSDGEEIEPLPVNLLSLVRIEPPEGLALPAILAADDVCSPLLGPRGATEMFGGQKGAEARLARELELSLENLAEVAAFDLGCDFRNAPGAGAAGGLGFGLMTFCRATLKPGFEVVAEALDLETEIAAADLVITGEGSLDAQTVEGKAPAGVAQLARAHQKPVLALAGSVANDARLDALFDATLSLCDRPLTLAGAVRDAAALLERAAECAARLITLSP